MLARRLAFTPPRRFTAAAALALAASVALGACAPRGGGGGPIDGSGGGDAGADAAADVAVDAPPPDANPTDARDVVAPDRGGPADVAEADVVVDYGTCGRGVRECLCGCGTNATCQGNCVATDMACGQCVYDAAAACCPAEATAFEDCIARNNCADQACVAANCGGEERVFNACFNSAQTRDPACTREVRACLGSDYPMVRCAM